LSVVCVFSSIQICKASSVDQARGSLAESDRDFKSQETMTCKLLNK